MLLVTDLQRGGTPLRIARLASGLREAGVDVCVGCLAPRGPVSEALERAGVPTFACEAKHPRDFGALFRLADYVRRFRPDLIHATLTHANVAARLVGLYLRIPVITSTATIEVERRWHRWAERLTGRLDHGHIVNSNTLAEHVARTFRLPRGRIHVVPPSIELPPCCDQRTQVRATLGLAAQEFVVLWAGRFDPVKRLDLVIQCAEALRDVPARFLLAGDGPERPRIEQLLTRSSAAGTVHLLGWRDDLDVLMAAADAFLLPSRTEGMPNAVLQAMAAGLPVVASDTPTLRELAGGGERICLVPRDQPKAFADALLALRAEPQRAAELGQRAAAWAREHLNPRETVAATLRVYRSVLSARCRAAQPASGRAPHTDR